MRFKHSLFALSMSVAGYSYAAELVSEATVKKQVELTKQHKLKNGIPVIYRSVPGSDLLQLNVSWSRGLKDLPQTQKPLNEWLFATMPMASSSYPKAVVNSTLERYGLELGCSGGIEMSSCSLSAVDDFWDKALPLFTDLIKNPAFTGSDLKLSKERMIASYKSVPSNPSSYVNDIINSVYYPKGHPYRLLHDEALSTIPKLDRKQLESQHKKLLNSQIMSLVIVTSLPEEKVISDLEKSFGSIPSQNTKAITVKDPDFSSSKAFSFHDRELPTAYIRIKFPTPGITHPDAIATKLMFEILSEELGEEIRTKRSLSYAVHAFSIQYSLGIGVIDISTAKPEETFSALQEVLARFKSRDYSNEEIQEFKHVFATSYYLTQETHNSLSSALGVAQHYFTNPTEIYEMPRKLEQVTSADIKRLANKLLGDFRVGIIFRKKKFPEKIAKDFIKNNRLKTPFKS